MTSRALGCGVVGNHLVTAPLFEGMGTESERCEQSEFPTGILSGPYCEIPLRSGVMRPAHLTLFVCDSREDSIDALDLENNSFNTR